MSAVLEPHVDPTLGLELVTGDEVALEATRHLFLAADLLDPARARDVNMPSGGEELPNRCMRRTSGQLRRCEITPVEFWGEPLPLELFPDGVRPYKLKGQDTEAINFNPTGVFNPRLVDKPLFFMPLFPGELIVDAVGVASGERRGIVEIEALRGVDYGGADREMQELFFGNFPLPLQLRLIREHIERVGDSVADPDAKSVAASMLLSCDQAREYMEDVVSLGNSQLDERVRFQHTYRMTPKLRHFMAQLEIVPRDRAVREVTNKVTDAAVAGGISAEQLEGILTRVLGEVTKAAKVGLPAE
jgi:hypothetical protein